MTHVRSPRLSTFSSSGLWIFGYGSLMWDPGFFHTDVQKAEVAGWHRRMSMVSTKSYGWAGRPGLAAGLHPGGTVAGLAFFVPQTHVPEVLAVLAGREWAYRCQFVTARLANGERVKALTYVSQYLTPHFRPVQPVPELMKRLAHGVGRRGSTWDYVARSAASLSAHGVRRSDLHTLVTHLPRARSRKRAYGPR